MAMVMAMVKETVKAKKNRSRYNFLQEALLRRSYAKASRQKITRPDRANAAGSLAAK